MTYDASWILFAIQEGEVANHAASSWVIIGLDGRGGGSPTITDDQLGEGADRVAAKYPGIIGVCLIRNLASENANISRMFVPA